MQVPALEKEIHRRLRAVGDAERRQVATWYFPTAMKVLGVKTPDLRAIVRDVSKRIKREEPAAVLELVRAILAKNTFEGRHAVYEILARHRALDTLKTKAVEELGRGMDNWATVDLFGVSIAGVRWREGGVTDAAVRRWTRSKDRWWRRAALVSTVALNMKSRGGSGDTSRTIDVCSRLTDDDDDMVVKGLSWALRSMIATDKSAVRRFLREHDLHSRVVREVTTKLTTGRKNA